MKFSRLLVLSALCLTGISAWAADLIERVAPEAPETQPIFGDAGIDVGAIDRTPVKFEVGKMYVLYNVTADKFYYQGCNWATQAAVDDTPLAVRFTLPDGKSLADAQLLFNDYNIYVNNGTITGWKLSFFDSKDAIYTDRASQPNYFWQVVEKGNNTYRLQASEANPDHKPSTNEGFVGFDDANASAEWDAHGRTVSATAMPISPFLTEGDGHHIDWQFFNVPSELNVWNEYFEAQDIYNKAEELKALINRADAMGIDVNAAAAVYNNEASTLEQLQAAIDALYSAMASGIQGGTPDNPTDATGMIANPDFDNASNAGWSGTKPNMVGSGSHGPANVAEVYKNTFDTYQELAGLPAGVYGLTASTTFRGSWDDFVNKNASAAVLYGKSGDVEQKSPFVNMWAALSTNNYSGVTEFGPTASSVSTADGDVTFYAPDDPSYARLMFEDGYYQNTVFFEVKDGAARIGVKNEALHTDGCDNWSIFDTFRLKYYGNEAGSYQKWVELSAPTFSEKATISAPYLEAYQSMISGQSAADAASAQAAVEAIKASQELQAIYDNQRAWALFNATLANARKTMVEQADFADDLTDYVQGTIDDMVESMDATTEELNAAVAELKRLIEKTIEDAKNDVQPGQDVTNSYLTNANFNNGGTGWTTGKGNITYRAGIAEAYDTNFDVYQDIKGPKVGVYQLNLKGFFRMERDDTAFTMYQQEDQKTDAGVYVGTTLSQNKTFLKCVFEEPVAAGTELASVGGMWECTADGNFYPNTMESAAPCFEAGMYENVAYGLVANEGETMRVGVSGDVTGANWICWDDFRLTYMGMDATVIQPILMEAAMNLDLNAPMGKDVYEEASAAKNAAFAGGDGQAMFNALKAIFAVRDKVAASQARFANLNTLSENELAVAISASPANQAAYSEALDLYTAISDGAGSNPTIYTDAQVDDLLAQMKTILQRLPIPENVSGSDAAPADVSGAILTNSFSSPSQTNSVQWWEGTTGYNFGNDADQKAALMLEFYEKDFDMYQDVAGLPAGTYELKVSAFKRGNADHDKATPAECEGAWLYAKAGDATASTLLPTIYAGSSDMDADIPNSMVTAQEFFLREGGAPYTVSVIIKKGEGTLRVGITQPAHEAGDWVIFDDFRLYYYGTESAKEQTGDGIEVVGTDELPVKVEFFTIDGRQASNAHSGLLIMKQTQANGQVIVKKIWK